jgi:hypothetical protein
VPSLDNLLRVTRRDHPAQIAVEKNISRDMAGLAITIEKTGRGIFRLERAGTLARLSIMHG